jgi:uncharacterized membrane protein
MSEEIQPVSERPPADHPPSDPLPAGHSSPDHSSSDHSSSEWTVESLDAMLLRALRKILIVGLLSSLILWKASNWRNAAMLAAGTLVSAASTLEWRRLVRFINARIEKKRTSRGASFAVVLFMGRLAVFAAIIYGSLRWFRGSVIALLCGLGLALLATVWEALRLLRD